jgi:hypothetical protein
MFSGCSSKYIENFMDLEEQSQDQTNEIPLPPDVDADMENENEMMYQEQNMDMDSDMEMSPNDKMNMSKNDKMMNNKKNNRMNNKKMEDASDNFADTNNSKMRNKKKMDEDYDIGTDENSMENEWTESSDIKKGQEISTSARKNYLKTPKELENVVSFDDVSSDLEEGFVGSSITGKYMLKVLLLSLLITVFIYIYNTKEISNIIKWVSNKIKALPHDVIHYGVIFLVIYVLMLLFD